MAGRRECNIRSIYAVECELVRTAFSLQYLFWQCINFYIFIESPLYGLWHCKDISQSDLSSQMLAGSLTGPGMANMVLADFAHPTSLSLDKPLDYILKANPNVYFLIWPLTYS